MKKQTIFSAVYFEWRLSIVRADLLVLLMLFVAVPTVAIADNDTHVAVTVDLVANASSGIEDANYTATLSDGTILGFYGFYYNEKRSKDSLITNVCGIISSNTSVTIPDSIRYHGKTSFVGGFGFNKKIDVQQAPNLVELAFPPTFLKGSIVTLPKQVKILHLPGYYPCVYDSKQWNTHLEKLCVPEDSLSLFSNDVKWLTTNPILAEGKDPLSVTINMAKVNEFAQKILEASGNNWLRVNELTVTGPLSTNDLNNFKRLTELTKLDLSAAQISYIPDRFCGIYNTENNPGFPFLNELALPELDSIGSYAFAWCKNLKKVSLLKVQKIRTSAFYQIGASSINLPEGLEEIGSSTFSHSSLKFIKIPSTVSTIPSSCFSYCSKLTNVELPSITTVEGYAFCNTAIKKIDLPKAVTISQKYAGAFENCDSLIEVNMPEATHIYAEAFFDCDNLKAVLIPKAQMIGVRAFAFCGSLETINIPSATDIMDDAFANCVNLKNVVMPKIQWIRDEAFSKCKSLENVTLPASLLRYTGTPFSGCSALKIIKCHAVTPPYSGGTSIIGADDYTNLSLYVPSVSIPSYRIHDSWKYFYTVKPLDGKIDSLDIYDDITIDDGSGIASGCVMDVRYRGLDGNDDYYKRNYFFSGKLDYIGNETVDLKKYSQYHYMGWPQSSTNQYYYNGKYTSLIAEGPMRADSVITCLRTHDESTWYFISLPYNVKVSDITYSPDCQWVLREYSGANRAAKDGSATWLNLTEDSIMQAHKGYILHLSNDGWENFKFPAINDTRKNDIFTTDDVEIPLEEHLSEFAHNRSWNLIGNPYPCWYDTRFLQTTTPIIVWNGYSKKYDAFSPVDDSFILPPNMAFFIQRPVDQSSLVFGKEGRQKDETIRTIEQASAKVLSSHNTRHIFNLKLTDGEQTDNARFVINNLASTDYEIDKDAEKMMPTAITTPLLYTIENGVRYAINERPISSGMVNIGYYAPTEGVLTLSMDNAPSGVILVDHDTNTETDFNGSYTFSSKKGFHDNRIELRFGDVTGITLSKKQTTGTGLTRIYTLDGHLVGYIQAE